MQAVRRSDNRIKQYMRQAFAILICSLCFCLPAKGQNHYVDSLFQWIAAHPRVDSQYIQTLHRISYRLSEKDVKTAFTYYEKVSFLSDSLHFTYGKGLAQINLGILLSNSGNFEASNNANFKAIAEAEACGNLRLQSVALNNIADNFKTLHDYGKSRQYIRDAIEINKKLQTDRGIAFNYELLFQCDFAEKLYAQSQRDLNTGMPFALKTNESYILSQYYLGYGKQRAVQGRADSAKVYFNLAMDQAKRESDLRNQSNILAAQAEFEQALDPALKINLLVEALRIARQTEFMDGISSTSRQLSLVYDQLQNKDSSFYFYHIYRSAADAIFSENNKRNVIIRESEWMIRRKEIENQNLIELSRIQRKEIAFKNGLLLAVLISLFLSIAIAFFISKSIQSKKEKEISLFNQKIAETQMQALRAQMNPHFIFNSLNSIENFMMKNEKRTASDYLGKFALLIRLILDSSSTELLPLSKDMQALKLYVELEQLRYDHGFQFELCLDEALTHRDFAVPGLLIQPYLENAIIHGLSHSIGQDRLLQLKVQMDQDYLVYSIEDNGVGRAKSALYNERNQRRHKSRGMDISRERVHILNRQYAADGKIQITDLLSATGEPAGTKVEVSFKVLYDAET